MTEIKNIAIIWESETIGGVNSFLKYLLQSKPFMDKEITIFTNIENGGANLLIKDLKEQKNIKFIFFKSFFVFNRKRIFLEKLLYYFLKPILLLITYFRFIKILSNHKFDTLLCSCGNYGSFRSEQAAILAAEKLKIPVKSIIIHHACVKPPLFMSLIFKLIDYLLTKKLTSLITVSKATKETLIKNSNLLNNDRLESYVIHNGVPKNNYEKKNYLKLKKNDNKKLVLKIGMVSRLSPDKGHEDLINAFSKLTQEYKNWNLFIIDNSSIKLNIQLFISLIKSAIYSSAGFNIISCGSPFCITSPSRKIDISSPIRKASSRSWVIKIIVLCNLLCNSSIISCILVRIRGSRAEKASSISKISASVAKARANPTLCCIPPDN